MKRIRLMLFVCVVSLAGIAGCHTADVPVPAVKELRYPAIVMYVRAGCPYCREAEAYFDARQIPFTKRDIMRDPSALRAYRDRYHGEIVPMIVFGNDERIVDGYDPSAIRDALRVFGLPAGD